MSRNESKNSASRQSPKARTVGKARDENKNANRKLIEKESKLRDELFDKLGNVSAELIHTLENGGVPKDPCVNDILKMLSTFRNVNEAGGKMYFDNVVSSLVLANGAIEKSWLFAECYPSIDVYCLIYILDQLKSLIIDLAKLESKSAQRKLIAIRANPKADPEAMASAEEAARQIEEVVLQISIGAYIIRALRRIAAVPVGEDHTTHRIAAVPVGEDHTTHQPQTVEKL